MGPLKEALHAASGADPALDARLATEFGAAPGAYTASVDAALVLLRHALPGWGWHVGWHANGVTPYASLHDATHASHVEAMAPTVPLALLKALAEAMEKGEPSGDS
jgi:hypothetical protein